MNLVECVEATPAGGYDYAEMAEDVAARQRQRAAKLSSTHRRSLGGEAVVRLTEHLKAKGYLK